MKVVIYKHSLGEEYGGPAEDFELYLVSKKIEKLSIVSNPLSSQAHPFTTITQYENGQRKTISKKRRRLLPPVGFVFDVMYLIRDQAEVVIAFNPWCLFLAKMSNRKAVLVYWGVDFLPRRNKNFFLDLIIKKIESVLFWKVELVFENNEYALGARLQRVSNLKRVQSKIVPIGFSGVKHNSTRLANDSWLRLIYFGSLDQRNGADRLIDIVLKLKEYHPNVILNIIGDGPLRAGIEIEVTSQNIEDCVKICGVLPWGKELEDYFLESDFGLAPYNSGADSHTKYADPGKLVAYIKYGVIPVVSNVPLVASVYAFKSAARVISEPFHPELWASEISKIHTSNQERQSLKVGMSDYAEERRNRNIHDEVFYSLVEISNAKQKD
jgi:glycosyltransferase involved in cell wall biosynthesis